MLVEPLAALLPVQKRWSHFNRKASPAASLAAAAVAAAHVAAALAAQHVRQNVCPNDHAASTTIPNARPCPVHLVNTNTALVEVLPHRLVGRAPAGFDHKTKPQARGDLEAITRLLFRFTVLPVQKRWSHGPDTDRRVRYA